MKNKELKKMAEKDAFDYGFAQMFFGEGAGVNRRMVDARIDERMMTIPGYEQAMDAAYAKISQIEMAERALKERKRLDRAAKAGKNLRAIKSGNLNNLSTGVFVVVGVAYVAHVTGYDKVALAEGKRLYKKAKVEVKFRTARMQGRNVEKIG